MNKKIIIQMPFNAQGFNIEKELNEEWIKYRLKIFADYTLNSLKAQTNQDFTTIIKCRDVTKDFIITEANKITSIPDNIRFMGFSKEYPRRIKELIVGYEYYYEIRLDSDDMYRKTFIDFLHKYNHKEGTEVLINQRGYLYDMATKRLVLFGYASPPFYTLVYKVEDYLRGSRYYLKKGHGSAISLKHEILKGYNFIQVIHEHNDSSSFEHFREIIGKSKEKDKKNILMKFGIK